MKGCRLTAMVAVFVFFSAAFAFQLNAHADLLNSPLPGIGPGIGETLSAAYDGETVFLPAVVITRIHLRGSTWWTVRDSEEPIALRIEDGVPTALRLNQTVDIQGQLYWSGTQPYLTNVQCWAYTDSTGSTILYDRDFPMFRGMMSEPWKYRVTMPVPHTTSVQSFGSIRVMDDDPMPPGGGTDSAGIMPIYCDTISDAIQCYDPNATDPILVQLETRPQTDLSASGFTVLEDTSSDQLPVLYSNAASTISTDDRINVMTGAIMCDSGGNYSIAVDSQSQDQPAGYVQALSPTSINGARSFSAGTEVSVSSAGEMQVYASFPGSVYCEMLNRSCGCRILCDSSPAVNSLIRAVGKTGLDPATGEWYIDTRYATDSNGAVSVDSTSNVALTPLGMPNKMMGGHLNTKPGQSVTGGAGLINLGLLVRTTGAVTYVDPGGQYFLMDDGSTLSNSLGSPYHGVKVVLTWPGSTAIMPPLVGWVMSVTGASCCESAGGACYPVLRPRNQADVTVNTGTETTSPTVTITTPSNGAMHIDSSGNNPVMIAGTATSESFVTSVQVKIDTGNWAQSNSFTPGAYILWTYNWSGITAGTHTIYVQATDYGGQSALTSESVQINPVSVIYVRPTGADSAAGTSWTTAKQTVIAGMSAASSGQDVWVMEGTYKGTATINLKAGVGLYGGFAGTERARENRNWSVNPTFLDGTSAGASVVTAASGVDSTGVIDGFTITNGTTGRGGGIFCNGGSPSVTHNTISNNTAGIYPYYSSGLGGGIYCSSSSAIITNNTITGNLAGGGSACGGGIYWYGSTSGRIANNAILNNQGQYGGGIYCTSSSPAITNNTIVYNEGRGLHGAGIYLSNASPKVTNNIIAYNYGGNGFSASGIEISSSPSAVLQYNDLYAFAGQSPNYDGIADQTGINGNISVNPLLQSDQIHINSDPNGNDCKDKGLNSAVLPTDSDVFGGPRVLDGTVDIGANEISGCAVPLLSFMPNDTNVPTGSQVTLTLHAFDPHTRGSATGCQVNFTVNAGGIVSISPDGYLVVPPSPAVSGWGTTDSSGNISITVTSSTLASVTVTATASQCGKQTLATALVTFGAFSCGFAYNLTSNLVTDSSGGYVKDDIEAYLKRIATVYPDVLYSEITDLTNISGYNTVIIAVPNRSLTPGEVSALLTFIDSSGTMKRIVLVGEYGVGYKAQNTILNQITQSLQMTTTFDVNNAEYDMGPTITRLCSVNRNHYLMAGVNYLWDGATDTFTNQWQLTARPLAYINQQEPAQIPWILEEDTQSAGSRICIHDTDLFDSIYNDSNDTVPDKNFRFVHNLCTIFQ